MNTKDFTMNTDTIYDALMAKQTTSFWVEFLQVIIATLVTMVILNVMGPMYLLLLVSILTFVEFFSKF